ncbi:NAD(P)H-dependent oxidoreductase [Sphaerisporangium corydalis]|uniref:NAD(P)H-dependent oxidoreductase n=1 Tax=Sphaerisporangium corydalis TaxID=1441875 RepID=A0ABV9EKN1_9ACTN|nr:NAD(P)H-dependent oxidoreductase [Sphaerisporangium corydalis]
MKVVGIAGSLLPKAYVRRLLEASALELPAPVEFEIWDGLADVPPFEDGLPLPRPVADLCEALSEADGMLVTAPAYSVLPPQLVHTLEWISSQYGGTILLGVPVVVVTACLRPYESMWTQTRLQAHLAAAGASVYCADATLSPALVQFDVTGRITDQVFRTRLRQVLHHLWPASLTGSRA